MASVTLHDWWLNLASDPSQYLVIRRAASGWTPSKTGDMRDYGGGRVRPVSKGGRRGVTTVHVRTTDMAMLNTLESWIGQTVCVRDERGRKAFGVFWEVPQTDDVARRVEFDLTITHRTWSEAV